MSILWVLALALFCYVIGRRHEGTLRALRGGVQ